MTSPNFSFPEAGLRFLRHLKRNNNRNWFLMHMTEYEETVKKPTTNHRESVQRESLPGWIAQEVSPSSSNIESSKTTIPLCCSN